MGRKNSCLVNCRISYSKSDLTPEAKANWFQSLSLDKRMDLLCELTDLILAVNPKILDSKNDATASVHVRLL
jgi:hypothetical protein